MQAPGSHPRPPRPLRYRSAPKRIASPSGAAFSLRRYCGGDDDARSCTECSEVQPIRWRMIVALDQAAWSKGKHSGSPLRSRSQAPASRSKAAGLRIERSSSEPQYGAKPEGQAGGRDGQVADFRELGRARPITAQPRQRQGIGVAKAVGRILHLDGCAEELGRPLKNLRAESRSCRR